MELRIARAHRISHSHFLGGAPVWTQQDRDKAIWLAAHEGEICRSCGTHPDEWDPAKGGSRNAYVAVLHRCAGCAATEQRQEALAAEKSKDRGTTVILRRPDFVVNVETGGGVGGDQLHDPGIGQGQASSSR